ncbi:gluconate 2-dehydrogenase subunit 3 family protein [Azorhizobium doebereinerae]|uniref:gluconate 2-dehydrogenase subunit 3 family protein n=1 Tax=Azorhizobium doebereinerae TaxID=281091 RepID=UPI000415FEFC|nr:gluconate 2-dehydrogenase subunit 3 family protein [Azorhizobium doebereinerae]
MISRRALLASTAAAALVGSTQAKARFLSGEVPWAPGAATPPEPALPGGWIYFTPDEARAVEAIVERLIPADELSPSGKDAGCAVFIDRQLAGPYGGAERLYMKPPFVAGTAPEFGPQSPLSPAQQYRVALKSLDAYCRSNFGGKGFAELAPEERDKVLAAMEKGEPKFDGFGSRPFFNLVLQNTMEGFFADPIYGGNRDMVGWKLIGFPGARYDYRDFIDHVTEPYTLPPVSLQGRAGWNPGR